MLLCSILLIAVWMTGARLELARHHQFNQEYRSSAVVRANMD
jgi:hypothetical protein